MSGHGRGMIAAGLLGAAALGMGLVSGPRAQAEAIAIQTDDVAAAKLVLVKFHADWCGKCRAMEAPQAKARAALLDEPVLFVEFDFTDQSTARHSGYLASLIGYETLWDTYERQTGFSILVNAETGEMLAEIRTPDAAAIESAVREHLSIKTND